ncbi:hypothetical protein E1B28_003926 [Marasmius oreades]|uniref:Protein BIG1 n=1 Tax=Marasmius oreades TaxID=181124 RepID=A0A9P7UXJ9_9AGAR|nr:uncharacterized protein E1B28_003926 [Marasmius oreades]KAG7096496.1 hypothetical protein E1B28_003926 [Marasmius oreades]
MSRLTLLLPLLPLVFAFSNTSPLVAWSSHRSTALDRLPLKELNTHSHVLESVISGDDICFPDALVIVEHPGLHASDLRNLPRSSHIARSLSSSPSSRQFAYLSSSSHDFDLASFAESVSYRCNSKLVYTTPGQGVELKGSEKSVIILSLPLLEFKGAYNRKSAMLETDFLLSSVLSTLPFDNHLIIYTGSHSPHSKRQAELDDNGNLIPDRPVLDLSPSSASVAPKNLKGGILHRYQLLTPGLIIILAIVLFLFLPVLYFGISALASIQSPLRIEVAPKGFNASDKKNQ